MAEEIMDIITEASVPAASVAIAQASAYLLSFVTPSTRDAFIAGHVHRTAHLIKDYRQVLAAKEAEETRQNPDNTKIIPRDETRIN